MEKRKPLRDSINSLLVFHEVVRHRSFTKAAEELFVSQPAVTKHIKGLEHKVGMRLIERGKGGFHLSEAGKILFKSAHKISNHIRGVESHLGRLKKEHHGLLRIGTTESYSRCLMPTLLSGFQNLYPSIKIALDVGNSEEIEKSLTAYRNDVAIIGMTKIPSKLESIPFLREDLVLIVSPSHPMAKREKISLKAIRKFPFIIRAKGSTTRKIVLKAFQELGIRPLLLIETGSSEFIKQWVSEGKGVSIIVRRIAEEEAKRGLIKMVSLDEKLNLQVALLFLKEERTNPTIKTFTHFIKDRGKEWGA